MDLFVAFGILLVIYLLIIFIDNIAWEDEKFFRKYKRLIREKDICRVRIAKLERKLNTTNNLSNDKKMKVEEKLRLENMKFNSLIESSKQLLR